MGKSGRAQDSMGRVQRPRMYMPSWNTECGVACSQMGHVPGRGLGRELQGIANPVEAHKRRGKAALGFYGSERTRQSLRDYPRGEDEDEREEAEFTQQLQQWKRTDVGPRPLPDRSPTAPRPVPDRSRSRQPPVEHAGLMYLQQTCQVKSAGLPSSLLVFLTPSTSLLGGRTFLLVLKKFNFWYFNLFSDFDLFFVRIHCLIIGSLQPVT